MMDIGTEIRKGLKITGYRRLYPDRDELIRFWYKFKNDTPFRIKLGFDIYLIEIREDDKIDIGKWGSDYVWLDEFTSGKFSLRQTLFPYFRRYVVVVVINVLEPVQILEYDVWTTDIFVQGVKKE